MADKTAIGWTNATWNPVTGCSKVSPGCAHCYAETLTRRFAGAWGVPDLPWTPENASENVILHPDRLDQPMRWRRPRMVFVNSMSDLFHELVPDEFIEAVWRTMDACPQHTFQVLTKRPERMRDMLTEGLLRAPLPLENVWCGVSIENRRYVDRADLLRETPAAVRFISAEPLLGPLIHDLDDWEPCWSDRYRGPELDLTDIDWLIVGGESGPGHRPMRPEWVRDLRDAAAETQRHPFRCTACGTERELWAPPKQAVCAYCRKVGTHVPQERGTNFFFKQWGGARPTSGGRKLDGRTWDEFPRAREAVAA